MGALLHAVLADVRADDLRTPEAQVERGVLLPLVREPVDLGEFWGVVPGLCQQGESAAGVDGLELRPVADQQHFGARRGGKPGQPVECQRPRQRGFVDDDELARPELGSPVVVFVQPLRGVVAGDTEVVGEDVRCGCGGGQADDAVVAVDSCPRRVERSHRCGLARPSRPDQQVDLTTGHAATLSRVVTCSSPDRVVPVVTRWAWRSAGGQLIFRRRIAKPRPAGTLSMPGDAARLRQWLDPESGAVMVHDPHQATLTAIVGVTHPAFILLDPLEQQRRITSWGRVLATACRSGRIASLQVIERTLPDSGKGLAEWWSQHGCHDGSWTSTTYGELIDRAGPAGERHASTVSISLDMKAASRAIRASGGGNRGAAAVLRQEMSTMTAALRSSDLAPSGWLEPGELAVILRSAYDPIVARALERHGELGRDLATAGPVAVSESWSSVRSDSAHHCVLWISEWPRSLVYPGFLAPVLLSSGVRRTFSLLYTPMRTDQAARDIRKKKTEYISDAAQRQRIGQIEDAQQSAEYNDVLQQEADLTAGHGILRATGLDRRQRPRPR